MDPNTNQPPQGRMPDPVSGPQPLPRAGTPDWQQGLGGPVSQPQPLPGADPAMPGPMAGMPPTGAPSNMPAQQPPIQPIPQPMAVPPQQPQPQPQSWQQPAAPRAGEISMTDPGATEYASPVSRRKKKWPAIVISIVVLLLLAGVTYVAFFRGGDDDADKVAKRSSNSAAVDGIDMATLQDAALESPEAIDGYTARQTGTSAVKDFVSADGNCELIVAIVSAGQLPGDNLEAIVKPQLDQLRQAGATVKGPSAGTALIVKDATDDSKTYRMPTLVFEFSQDKKRAIVHYSAVIMKNSDRAVVNRSCVNKDGEVDQDKLKALDETAKRVLVRP